MTPIEIYWISGSPPSWRVLLALKYKGIKYNSNLLNASQHEHKSADFLKLNPRGRVPVIKHGDFVLRESLAILGYLEHLCPSPAIFGDTAEETALTWQWVVDFEGNLRPHFASIARIAFRHQLAGEMPALHMAIEQLTRELLNIEHILVGSDFIMGATPKASDIALYPGIQWLKRALNTLTDDHKSQQLLKQLEESSAFKLWEARIETFPEFDQTVPPHWK